MNKYDVIIIGAGAAGLMCAIECGKRGRRTLLLEHTQKIGEKIRISGGGRCNFTNIHAEPSAYLSHNPHFCKSALSQYTQYDFIDLVEKHSIAYHEKTLGQLFCDNSAKDIIDMLLKECAEHNVDVQKGVFIADIDQRGGQYQLTRDDNKEYTCESLVIATGGLSIPKIGATKFGFTVAEKFGLPILEKRAALVPLTFTDDTLIQCKDLSGLSVDAVVSCNGTQFREGLLFTHRGLSGPSILQISSYWKEGDEIIVNLAPDHDANELVTAAQQSRGKQDIVTIVSDILPKRLVEFICQQNNISGKVAELSKKKVQQLHQAIHHWTVKPNGSEGYRTAEVTLGGIDTDELSSKTMECKKHKGLYFIGEVVDVTGHLGGYNFQWAWSSGYVAGQYA